MSLSPLSDNRRMANLGKAGKKVVISISYCKNKNRDGLAGRWLKRLDDVFFKHNLPVLSPTLDGLPGLQGLTLSTDTHTHQKK